MVTAGAESGGPSEALCQQQRPVAILFNLATEIDRLREPLTTLAFATAELAREPQNRELRDTVARGWTQICSILDRHSVKDDRALFAEAAAHPGFRPDLIERLRARLHRVRNLRAEIVQAPFEQGGGDAEVAEAATRLHCLTVVLEDIITAEEGEILPMLRRLLFAPKSR